MAAPGSTAEDVRIIVLTVGTAEVAFVFVVLPAGLVVLPPLR